jgi:hypothetical protein
MLYCFSYFVSVGEYPFSMDEGALTLLDRISNVEFDKVTNMRTERKETEFFCDVVCVESDL